MVADDAAKRFLHKRQGHKFRRMPHKIGMAYIPADSGLLGVAASGLS
jgi:hypothetical protein